MMIFLRKLIYSFILNKCMTRTTRMKKKLLIKSELSKTDSNNFVVTDTQCWFWWRVINIAVFKNELNPPSEFILKNFYKGELGWCKPVGRYSQYPEKRIVKFGIKSTITSKHMFLSILIHEMVHQWEYQILGEWDDNIQHGKNFYSWREPIQKMLGITIMKRY